LREQLVNLEINDDYHSARDKMGQVQVDRVLLVWPEPRRSQNIPLARRLDLLLVHRHATRLGAHLGVVTDHEQIIEHAGALGIPVFDSVNTAHVSLWRSRTSLRPAITKPPGHTKSLKLAKHHLDSRRKPRVSNPKFDVVKGGIYTAIGMLSIGTLVLLAIPSAAVTLTPKYNEVQAQVNVVADPNINTPDYDQDIIVATSENTIVNGVVEIEATGTSDLSIQYASGAVIFTNLTFQPVTIPAGTAVSTSSRLEPVTYVTQRDAALDGKRGLITIVEVRAALPGPVANVGPSLINRVEGPLSKQVAVTNRQAITGGQTVTVPAVTRLDRSTAYDTLVNDLRRSGFADIVSNLPSYQLSSIESAEIKDVLELTYSHAIGEHTDILTVTMQAIVSIAVIDEQDAYRVGYKTLQNQLGSNMKLYEDTVYYSHSNTTSTNQPGEVSIQVTAKGIAAPDITLTNVRNTIRWKPVAQAKRDLLQTFPLGKSPDIVIRPAWLNRIPWLTWRTRITINQPDFATN
tara:strand:+ start:36260 stop:37810 length:1551 start_codon:yes stop_codon:yes gene_type:complete